MWVNVMIDFISKGFTDQTGTRSKRKIQFKNIHINSDINSIPYICTVNTNLNRKSIRFLMLLDFTQCSLFLHCLNQSNTQFEQDFMCEDDSKCTG